MILRREDWTTKVQSSGKGAEIVLPAFGIVVQLNEGGGSITSDLTSPCTPNTDEYKHAIDGLLSLVLAHACAGMDITSPAYLESIKTAVEAISNHLD